MAGNYRDYTRPTTSWGTIFLLLFLFFPVGIYLLVKKVTGEKYSYIQNARVMNILGWIFIGMGALYLLLGLSGELTSESGQSAVPAVIVAVTFFGGGGTALVINGHRFKKRGEKFSRYVAIVNAQDTGSLDAVAAAYPAAYENVCKDIQQMINRGYFLNAYIDLNRRALISPAVLPAGCAVNTVVTVVCTHCGATNARLSNQAMECEYCGAPL